MKSDPGSITDLIIGWRAGQSEALDRLARLVDSALRARIGQQLRQMGGLQSVDPTEILSEVWMKLVAGNYEINSRNHLYALAALAARHILRDHVKRLDADKRRSELTLVPLHGLEIEAGAGMDFVTLNRVFDELEEEDELGADICAVLLFSPATPVVVANVFDISISTVNRKKRWARAHFGRVLQS